MAMTDWNFMASGGSQPTGLTAGVVAENNVNVNTFQRLAVIDNAPPNSLAWREAAAELAAIVRECHRLALRTGDRDLISEAKASLALVAGFEMNERRARL